MISRLLKRDPAPEEPAYLRFEKRNPFIDFWDYMREKRPHRWSALALAFTIGLVSLWALNRYLVRPVIEGPTLIYYKNLDNRSDADIRRDWVERLKQANRNNAKRRANYQKMADTMGIEYDAAQADADTTAILNANYDDYIRTGDMTTLPKAVFAPPKDAPQDKAGADATMPPPPQPKSSPVQK